MRAEALKSLVTRLGIDGEPEDLYARLTERARAYKRWSEETLWEGPEEEIWVKRMLPDHEPAEIRGMAAESEHLWGAAHGSRVVRPDTEPVIAELHASGYGLISQ